jgi:hypothetical protein
MKTFNFEITFICANSNESTIIKEYKAIDYIQAKKGIKDYCSNNKTFKSIVSLRTLKFGVKSVNLMLQDNN